MKQRRTRFLLGFFLSSSLCYQDPWDLRATSRLSTQGFVSADRHEFPFSALLAATISFAAGAAVAASLVHRSFSQKCAVKPNKVTHAREWAVWTRIDRTRRGYVTRKDIYSLCCRAESEEHGDQMVELMDPRGTDRITFADWCENFRHIQVMRHAARLKMWHRCCGIGVAGNVAGHMAQAGEAGKESKSASKPAGIFSFYMPHKCFEVCDNQAALSRLQFFPVTYAVIDFPNLPGCSKVQVEPEMGLLVDIVYSEDRRKVKTLIPRRVAAFNDCSIRSLDGANKLSQKKNWGFGSKGISIRTLEIDGFSRGSVVDHLAIISYVKRDGEIHLYSENAPVRNYLMFYDELLDWIIERMNNQLDDASFEPVFPLMVDADYPTSAWIALGAGMYTEWGATNYIQKGDEAVIMVYDERDHPNSPAIEIVEGQFEDRPAPKSIVCLHQTFC